jgi:hypothetical protein
MFWLPTPWLYQQKCSTSKNLHKSLRRRTESRKLLLLLGGGANKFSSREEEEADQSVVFRDFSSDYFCESEKLIFFFF